MRRSFSKSWSPCGRSVQAHVWQGVAVPWLLGYPRRPVMMSQRWGPHPRVAGTCVWKCSSQNHPGLTVRGQNGTDDLMQDWTQTMMRSLPFWLMLMNERAPTFSAWTSIWLLDVVTMTSSGEKSRTSTVNWYESPRALMFPVPPKQDGEHRKKDEDLSLNFHLCYLQKKDWCLICVSVCVLIAYLHMLLVVLY